VIRLASTEEGYRVKGFGVWIDRTADGWLVSYHDDCLEYQVFTGVHHRSLAEAKAEAEACTLVAARLTAA
jgi:hypothetical protein